MGYKNQKGCKVMKMKLSWKRYCILILMLLFCINLAGCAETMSHGESTEEAQDGGVEQQLKLSVTADASAGVTVIPPEKTGGNFERDIRYEDVTDVRIEIDGERMKLEDALAGGMLSEEEIFCFARLDAKNGFCQEKYESRNGLTHFTYHYPEFDLRILYDVYETPDGQQHLISDLAIYRPGTTNGAYVDFYDDETGHRLDREDWGIELELMEVSATGMTICCKQSGGQQIGELEVEGYHLADADGFIETLDASAHIPNLGVMLQMDGETLLTMDWTDVYGELPSGEYLVGIHVYDKFAESQVHPLMTDYHDWQVYDFVVEIP